MSETLRGETRDMETLGDAWRLCLRNVDESIFWLQHYAKGLAAEAWPGWHEWRLRMYAVNLRRVSEYEAQMNELGREFKK
jgi:hypothetical protein